MAESPRPHCRKHLPPPSRFPTSKCMTSHSQRPSLPSPSTHRLFLYGCTRSTHTAVSVNRDLYFPTFLIHELFLHDWLKSTLRQNARVTNFPKAPTQPLACCSPTSNPTCYLLNLVQKHNRVWSEQVNDVKASILTSVRWEVRPKCRERILKANSQPHCEEGMDGGKRGSESLILYFYGASDSTFPQLPAQVTDTHSITGIATTQTKHPTALTSHSTGLVLGLGTYI